jgi:hypothetical protein
LYGIGVALIVTHESDCPLAYVTMIEARAGKKDSQRLLS